MSNQHDQGTLQRPAPDVPIILQGSTAPVFKGRGSGQLLCDCGQLLIADYEPRCYAGFLIRCHSCSGTTPVASWPDDEPMPLGVVNLGDRGTFLVKGTVDAGAAVLLTVQQEIDRIDTLHRFRMPASTPIDLDEEGLAALQARLEAVSKGRFKAALGQMRRNMQSDAPWKRLPLAWALLHTQGRIERRLVDFASDDGVAIAYLRLAVSLINSWERHPMLDQVLFGLFNEEFHHAPATLATADYLRIHNKGIGVTDARLEQAAGRRSPDLFANMTPTRRLSIEVKAPEALRWPMTSVDRASATALIERIAKGAKKQMSGAEGGLLVIAASFRDDAWHAVVTESVCDLLARGRISARINGVAVAFTVLDATSPLTSLLPMPPETRIALHKNPRFNGTGQVLSERQ